MTAPALALPFEVDDLLAGLKPWIECESPTFDTAAVNRMMDLASRDLALMGARVERIAGRMGRGDCVRARFPHPEEGKVPGVLILAHLDTVHPVGTLAALPFRREGDVCYGPGIVDMKGGTYIALRAAAALARAGLVTPRPISVLLTSDEEIGSPSTRDLIEAEAARHAVVLVPEPGKPDGTTGGGVTSGRYAIARFNLRTTGRPSHAGAALADGRSAIREMCRQIMAIEAMTSEACTFSVGVIRGGQWVNCVATHCDAEALSMAKRQEDLDTAVQKMLALAADGEVGLEVTRGVTRPVWEPDEAVLRLFGTYQGLAAQLGLSVSHASSGGGSDGNFTGAMGIPTLDGLGVIGAGIHTLGERVDLSSLVPRARLFAGMLMNV